jgi:predicted transposase YdaD
VEYIRQLYKLKRELDYQSGMAWEREEAREEGRAKGLEEGRTEGLKEGLKEGLEEGFTKANMKNAEKMKAMGFSAEQIQAVTGLSSEAVTQL